jgi:hypothetical protein
VAGDFFDLALGNLCSIFRSVLLTHRAPTFRIWERRRSSLRGSLRRDSRGQRSRARPSFGHPGDPRAVVEDPRRSLHLPDKVSETKDAGSGRPFFSVTRQAGRFPETFVLLPPGFRQLSERLIGA